MFFPLSYDAFNSLTTMERRRIVNLPEGSIGAAGLAESEGSEVYAWSEVETSPLDPLTVVLWLLDQL